MRRVVFKIEAEDLRAYMAGERVEAKGRDNAGIRWSLLLRKEPLPSEDAEGENPMEVIVEECPTWAILIGGHIIGYANHEDPAEAVREAFADAGLSSLPEGVEIVARRDDEGTAFVVFTLDGKAFCTPHAQFLAEVVKSDRWISTQQAKRTEIDALMDEIKNLANK